MSELFDPHLALEAYFAGEIDADEAMRLRAWMEAEQNNFVDAVERAKIHGLLSVSGVRYLTDNIMEEALPANCQPSVATGRPLAIWLGAAAVVAMGLLISLVSLWSRSGSNSVATLVAADDVVWNSQPVLSGDSISPGTIDIASGQLTLRLASHAELQASGLIQFEVRDAKTVVLQRGAAKFHCPPEARGFQVTLPGGAEVTDLGTDFEVRVDGSGKSRVLVTQGRVEVRAPGEALATLNAGEHLTVTADGVLRIGDIAAVNSSERWQDRMQELADNKHAFIVLPLNGDGVPLHANIQPDVQGRIHAAVDRFGELGGAAHFDGQTSLKYPLGWPTDEFTLSLWVRVTKINAGEYLMAVEAGDGRRGSRRLWMTREAIKADAFVFGLPGHGRAQASGNPRSMGASGKLVVGQWTHVVATFRRRKEEQAYVAIYLDGRRASENTFDYRAKPDPLAQGLTIGCGALHATPQTFFRGDLDDVVLIEQFFSEEQVRDLFEASRAETHEVED